MIQLAQFSTFRWVLVFCISSFFHVSSTFSQAGEPLKILFVGNSYTHYNNMPKIFDKMVKESGQEMDVEMSAASGHSFKMHCQRPEMFQTIKSKKWDYVVLQGFSRELSYAKAHIDTASVPYIRQILDSIYANNSCTKVMLFMTWGYKNGWKEREEIASFNAMGDSIRRGYEYISESYDLPIVPVGGVWKEVLHDSTIALHQEDQQHPNDAGSYLTASTFYAALFSSMPNDSFHGKLKEDDAVYLQKKAYDYVSTYAETFKLQRNTMTVNYVEDKPRKVVVEVAANYPEATSYSWNLDDGAGLVDSAVTYTFKKPGTYPIELEVQSSCGSQYARRIVQCKRKCEFRKPKRRSSKVVKEKS